MDILKELKELDMTVENTIVIGSGILDALGIRSSNDIDVVVSREKYDDLYRSDGFAIAKNHGREVLTSALFEIGIDWEPLDEHWYLEDLLERSQVIGGVRYISLELLLEVKIGWQKNGEAREKDLADIELIEKYLKVRS